MCAVFGFLDYKGKISNAVLKRLIYYLSVAAEVRGTDATGIAYVRDGSMVTYKKPKPAHKVKLFFPRDTRAVIGHTRFTTQGSEKRNCNNHPFKGHCGKESFALAHNGVLYNDRELRREQHLPTTPIETDTYVAVQLLEQGQNLDAENIKRMAELVEGSFVFTILRNDNTLFLVKGNNPLTVYHFPTLGLYIYASTKSILDNALKKVNLNGKYSEVDVSEGEIVKYLRVAISIRAHLKCRTTSTPCSTRTIGINWTMQNGGWKMSGKNCCWSTAAHLAFPRRKYNCCWKSVMIRTRSKNCSWTQRQWRKQLARQKHCYSVKHKTKNWRNAT